MDSFHHERSYFYEPTVKFNYFYTACGQQQKSCQFTELEIIVSNWTQQQCASNVEVVHNFNRETQLMVLLSIFQQQM